MDHTLKSVQLTILTTNNCTARCSHCVNDSLPGRQGTLTYAQIREAIESLHNFSPLSLVIFTGGEPLLLGEDLLDAISYADSLGILTRIVTNAFWADTLENAKKTLTMLKEAGLNEVNVSTDDYHLPYIPFENIRNVYNAIQGMGFGAFVIANTSSYGDIITPEYLIKELGNIFSFRFGKDGKSLPQPKPSKDGTAYLISNGRLQEVGRASSMDTRNKENNCEDCIPLNCGCTNAVTNIVLSPNAHLLACCGIEAEGVEILDRGKLSRKNISEHFKRINDDVLLNALIRLGPYFVRNFITSKDPSVIFENGCTTLCEICQSVVLNKQAISVLKHNIGELAQFVLMTMEDKSLTTNH
jgi:hypothetical protein